MNQRNVDALSRLLDECDAEHQKRYEYPIFNHPAEKFLVKWLAERVLVPSALTADEVGDLFDVPAREEFRAARVEGLEKIARGE